MPGQICREATEHGNTLHLGRLTVDQRFITQATSASKSQLKDSEVGISRDAAGSCCVCVGFNESKEGVCIKMDHLQPCMQQKKRRQCIKKMLWNPNGCLTRVENCGQISKTAQ